jgi:hypothetical protein
MAEASRELNSLFKWIPWHIGDPAVLLESILGQVEGEQGQQITTLYLDTVAATLEANLRFVQGVRAVVASAKR